MHKHLCLQCEAVTAEGNFDCESDTDHDFEICSECLRKENIHKAWLAKRDMLRAQPIPNADDMEHLKFGSESQHAAWAFYRRNLKELGSHEEAVKKSFWYLDSAVEED